MYFVIFGLAYPIPLTAGLAVSAGILMGLIFGAVFNGRIKNSYAVFISLFYFLTVVALVMLPVAKISNGVVEIIEPENNLTINLDLLRPFRHSVYMRDFLLNLFMLTPLGFSLCYAAPKKFWLCFSLCVIASVALEALQLFSPSRVTDVNDFFYNFFGAFLGLLAAKFFRYAADKT